MLKALTTETLKTITKIATPTKRNMKLTRGRQLGLLWVLVACSLVFQSSYSNADVGGTGPNGGVITSETLVINPVSTTVTDLGNGFQRETVIESHVTTIIEDVTTQEEQQITTQVTTTETRDVTTEVVTENTSSNYLTNPSFDDSTTSATGWTSTGTPNNPIGTATGQSTQNCFGTITGGNCAKTGNLAGGGTTLSQTVDLFDKMNQTSVNRGFDLRYGAQVASHESNASVPVCTSTGFSAAGGDCRDTYSIGMQIKDSNGTVLHNFLHEFNNITFTGLQDNYFTQAIPSNSYTSAFATLNLHGIDMGFNSGSFGPTFDEAIVQTTFDVITYVTTQVIDTIITDVTSTILVDVTNSVSSTTSQDVTTITDTFVGLPVEDTPVVTEPIEPTTPEVEIVDTTTTEDSTTETSFTVEVTNTNGEQIESFEVSVETNIDTGIAEITVADASGGVQSFEGPVTEVAQVDTQVAAVETQIEAQVESQVEAQVEAQVEVADSSTEATTESTPSGLRPDSQQAEAEPEATVEVESTTESSNETEEVNTQTAEAEVEVETEESSNNSNEQSSEESSQEETNDGNDNSESDGNESTGTANAKKTKEEKSDSENKSTTQKTKPKQVKSKAELKKQVAAAVVSKIVEKLGTDSVSQGTQLALMNLIGADITSTGATLVDRSTTEWYSSTKVIPDQPQLVDLLSAPFALAQDRAMNALVDFQYQNLK